MLRRVILASLLGALSLFSPIHAQESASYPNEMTTQQFWFYLTQMPAVAPSPTMVDVVGLTQAMDLKADVSTVSSSLALKANASDLTAGLALKVDTSTYAAGLAGKAGVSHTHVISDTAGLQPALDGKASITSLTNVLISVTDLRTSVTTISNTLPLKASVYASGSVVNNARLVVAQGTVSGTGGLAPVYLTDTGTAGGNALFGTGVLSVQPVVNDASTVYPIAWTLSGDRKTLTVTLNKAATPLLSLLGINILAAPTASPSGTLAQVLVTGY